MAQTNDEIINKHPAKCKEFDKADLKIYGDLKGQGWSIPCVRDCMNEARLATLDDCKSFLERELNHAKTSRIAWKSMDARNERKETIEYLLAELEALRKKVMP